MRKTMATTTKALALAAGAAILAPSGASALFDPCDVFLGGDWIGVLNPNDFQACYLPEDAKGPGPLTDDFVMAFDRDGNHAYDIFGSTTCNPDGFIGGGVSVFSTMGEPPTIIPVIGRFRSTVSSVRTFDAQEGKVRDTAKLQQRLALKGKRLEERKAKIAARGARNALLQNYLQKSDSGKIVPPPEFFQALLLERMRWDVTGCLAITGGNPACFDITLKYALANCAFSGYYLDGNGEFTKPGHTQFETMGYFDSPGVDFFGGRGLVKNTFFDPVRDRLGRNQTSFQIGSLWTRSTAVSFLDHAGYESFLSTHAPCFYNNDVLGPYFEHGFLGYSTPSATTIYQDRTLSQ